MPDSWKREKTNDNNLSKSQSIRREDDVGEVLESTPNLSTGSTNILEDDSQVGKNADPQVPESTPTNREIGSGATTRRKAIIKNKEKAQSNRREDDVGEDDDEAMEITQEEKSSGENLPNSSLEDDVGEVLESTPNLSTGLTNILRDDSQVGKNADNEVIPQVTESTPTNREIGSGATTTIRGFEETVSSNVQPAEKKRRVSSLTSPGPAKVQLKIATNSFLSQLSSEYLIWVLYVSKN
jgi:hypothetical protein